jgi:hypothetical protein
MLTIMEGQRFGTNQRSLGTKLAKTCQKIDKYECKEIFHCILSFTGDINAIKLKKSTDTFRDLCSVELLLAIESE